MESYLIWNLLRYELLFISNLLPFCLLIAASTSCSETRNTENLPTDIFSVSKYFQIQELILSNSVVIFKTFVHPSIKYFIILTKNTTQIHFRKKCNSYNLQLSGNFLLFFQTSIQTLIKRFRLLTWLAVFYVSLR